MKAYRFVAWDWLMVERYGHRKAKGGSGSEKWLIFHSGALSDYFKKGKYLSQTCVQPIILHSVLPDPSLSRQSQVSIRFILRNLQKSWSRYWVLIPTSEKPKIYLLVDRCDFFP